MTLEEKRAAWLVGYRYGIGAGSYYDWAKLRRATKPDDMASAVWQTRFDEIAQAGCKEGEERLARLRAALSAEAEQIAAARVTSDSEPCAAAKQTAHV